MVKPLVEDGKSGNGETIVEMVKAEENLGLA